MPEARQLKAGRWRLYITPQLIPVRDPATGAIATFNSLEEARGWWQGLHPSDAAPTESMKCGRCGAYFGRESTSAVYQFQGRYYHLAHAPLAATKQSGL